MQPDSHHMPLSGNGIIVSSDKRPWNPLSTDPVASRFSSYAAFHDETVIRPLAPDIPVHAELIDAHTQLRQKILDQFYPCVGATSTFSRNSYRFGLYPELAGEGAVCHDLYDFCHEFPILDDHFLPSSRCSMDQESGPNNISKICYGLNYRPCTLLIQISLPGTRVSTLIRKAITFHSASAGERCMSLACTLNPRVWHERPCIRRWYSICTNSLFAYARAESLKR